ncbi:hypothetical protein SUGI_0871880 [Cryptomeria japonica]|nr:hypothetical protein SUGI_0871880 [Cryptomeria japonica]
MCSHASEILKCGILQSLGLKYPKEKNFPFIENDAFGPKNSIMGVKNGGDSDSCSDFKMIKKMDNGGERRKNSNVNSNGNSKILEFDALFLPLGLSNVVFFVFFFTTSYSMNSLGVCKSATYVRRSALEFITRRSLGGLPFERSD